MKIVMLTPTSALCQLAADRWGGTAASKTSPAKFNREIFEKI
jgi:hypothetical protein